MATLTNDELVAVRKEFAAAFPDPGAVKATINTVAQAVETWLASNAASLSAAIDTATDPIVLSAARKKKIVAEVLRLKFMRDR